MKLIHVFIFCFFSAVCVCVEASALLEVSGHIGGQVSIRCSGNWTTDNSSEHYNMYFCKGVCSTENTVIQSVGKKLAVTRRGRYSMDVNTGDRTFSVTIKRLKTADAGRYRCGAGKTFDVLYQEVNLVVLNTSTVPPGSPPFTTALQTEAETYPQGSLTSNTPPSPSTRPTAEEKTNQQAATKLTDTTVVIIVSVSLALLVCAIIPLIFYGHCRSKEEGENKPENKKGEADCCEQSTDAASTQTAVRLQSLDPDAGPESSTQGDSQYAVAYQALDPKSLD